MNILLPIETEQELRLIPRKYIEVVDMVMTDSNTRVETEYTNLTTTIEGGYMTLRVSYTNLENNRFYTIRIKNADEVLYSGMIFSTDQTDLENYKLNDDNYSSSNDTDGIIYID